MIKSSVIAASLTLLFSGAAMAADDLSSMSPEQIIKHRHQAFHQIKDNAGNLRSLAKSGAVDQTKAKEYVAALEAASDRAFSSFVPGTEAGVADSEASKKIWQDPDGFKAAQGKFHDALGKVSAAADARDSDALTAAVGELGGSCKGCHSSYRE
ncbi:c-type cytochrome [Pokkaliibacter sp. CJK22405]|uniref:c-type cytochrome n=1 Tax=Pokkaliibacter sp. CJK22405 TaxID=3384615 RepID=UPI0039852864